MKTLYKNIVLLIAVIVMELLMGTAFLNNKPMLVQAAEVESLNVESEAVAETPQVEITFQVPEGWQNNVAKIGIQVTDKKNTGQFSIAKVEARISEDGSWEDITGTMEVSISGNCSLYIRVTDQSAKTHIQNRYIECFDKTKPTLSAVAKDGVLIIQGADEESGVAAIYVNGSEFTELEENTLYVRLQQGDTSYQQFTLQVRDHAGNVSENYKVANPYYESPETKKQDANQNSGDVPTNQLPSSGNASKPTNATGTVTEHQTTEEPSVAGTSEGVVPGAKGKEFYTIQTKGDKVFYLIVDKDKSSDNVYLLTEVGENDLLNFSDSDMVTLPQNNAVSESALPLDIKETSEDKTATENKTKDKGTQKAAKKEIAGNKGTYILMGVVLVVIGGVYYLKVVKGKRNTFEEGYDEEDEEEDALEVYGDDNFEDKEVEVDADDEDEDEEYM